MGGCASKPKDLNNAPATLPGENHINHDSTPKNVEVDTPAPQEEKSVDEPQKEEPDLVDLSEPAAPLESSQAEGEAVSAEPKNAGIEDLVSGIVAQPTVVVEDVTAKQTEEKVEAGNQTTQQIKDEPVVVANLAEKTTDLETPKSNDAGDHAQVATSATAEKKTDEPIVHV